MSIKISEEVENYIPVLRKQLLFSEKEHKWIILRFMVNLSLSISRDFDLEKSDFIPFREYRLEQIVGKGKGGEDYYWQYWKMLEAFGDKKFKDEKAFENSLEFHINRAYHILKTSLSSNSNIYQFMIDEFF